MLDTPHLLLIFIFAVSVALLLAWVLSVPVEPHYVDGKVREIPATRHVDERV